MKCPRCQAALKSISYEGIHLESCDGCGGEWLDADELGHVARVRETRFAPDERRAVAAAAKIAPVIVREHDHDLACPKCGGTTDALNYGGDSGIVIDRCTGCNGIWLDAAELDGVQLVVEGWQDGLPDDLKQYGKKLRQVATDVDTRTRFNVSRYSFINSIINGILDVAL